MLKNWEYQYPDIFEFLGDKKIGVYIDFSNLYHAKYTLGWEYDMKQFLSSLLLNRNITHVGFYWAYDKLNVNQFNWKLALEKKFNDQKFHFYFKKLELKGGKQKGNVDTEMWYDICEQKDKREVLVLFSGDGDFQYIVDKLITNSSKNVVIISTRGHINQELINYTQKFSLDVCRFIDLHQDNEISWPIKERLKSHSRWVCIPPELYKKISEATPQEITNLKDWVECILANEQDKCPLPVILSWLFNKNEHSTKKTLLHWKKEEKEGLLIYLNSLLS